MKNGVVWFLVSVLAGMMAFCAMRWHTEMGQRHHGSGVALDAMPELEWLKKDLDLTDDQFAVVRKLHATYRPKCAEMCRRISEAHEKVEALATANRGITPEYQAALKEHAEIHVECQQEMLNHLYQTAATLRGDQAKRYLDSMLPFALDFSHSESGNLHAR